MNPAFGVVMKTLFSVLCLAAIVFALPVQPEQFSDFPEQIAGYINVNEERGHHLFYWVCPSQSNPDTDPVVLWLQGGPGAPGLDGLWYENGPLNIDGNMTLTPNPYSWNLNATVVYIDQPIGTGFAYSDHVLDETDIKQKDMMAEVYTFLQLFFKQYPQYSTQPFYLFGESYGGHYAPVLATTILEGNRDPDNLPINLRGVGLGDGWVDPVVQYKGYIDFSVEKKLINGTLEKMLRRDYELCAGQIRKRQWIPAAITCNAMVGAILLANPGMSFYDIRLICPKKLAHDCYDFSPAIKFVQLPEVRRKIHVPDHIKWRSMETPFAVIAAVDGDEEMSFADHVGTALDAGVDVLIYNGEYDFAANYVGAEQWLQSLAWSGAQDFNAASLQPWQVDGEAAGLTKSFGALRYIRFGNSGHMVPMDQPKIALSMFMDFVHKQ